MRLINTRTFEVASFVDDLVPPYAILSHTWGDEEVTLQDFSPTIRPEAKELKGFIKIKRCCTVAARENHDWLWVDTCCIDKLSSAELSEAINSMYRWYKGSKMCYAHLADVSLTPDQDAVQSEFAASRWFTRGWTLQELICPVEVEFYDQEWQYLGSRTQLEEHICQITKIPSSALHQAAALSSFSTAQKMSWAYHRETTREEDLAYCLLGIFDINMPLLYGEGGEKAFIRLQEEIIRVSDDESIFAWKAHDGAKCSMPWWGLLAPSPAFFKHAGDISQPRYGSVRRGAPTTMTNRGLRIEFELVAVTQDISKTVYVALLNCMQGSNRVGIVLQEVAPIDTQFARILTDVIVPVTLNTLSIPVEKFSDPTIESGKVHVVGAKLSPVYVRQIPQRSNGVAGFAFRAKVPSEFEMRLLDVTDQWNVWSWGGAVPFTHQKMVDGHYLLLDFDSAFEEFSRRNVDVSNITGPVALGAIRLGIKKKGVAEEFHLDLVIGIEPPPETPFLTPHGFSKPWYSLQYPVCMDLKQSFTLWERRTTPRTTQLSLWGRGGGNLKAAFAMDDKFSRFFCQVQVVIE